MAVVEQEGFGAAADKLGRTTSHVSRAIARLETTLALRLVSRTTRRVQATPEGRLLCDRYRQVLSDLRTAHAEVTELGAELGGTLRVSVPISYGRNVLMPMIVRFQSQHPALQVEVSFSDRYIDLLHDRFDAAVRIGISPRAHDIAVPLATARFGIYASPSYLARSGQPGHPDDLERHERLTYTYPDTEHPYPWELVVDGERRIHHPSGRLTMDSGEALVTAACEGAGLVYVQDHMVSSAIQSGRLEPVLEAFWPPGLSVAVVYREPRRWSHRVAALVEFLREAFAHREKR